MTELASDTQAKFLQRIERRMRFLKTLQEAALGIYLPADEQQRKRAIDSVVRMTARQSELAQLTTDTLGRAAVMVRTQLDAMQQVLPHDVQYRNRVRRDW
jgi:hypothetical protein